MNADLLTIAAEWVFDRGVSIFPLLLGQKTTFLKSWKPYQDRLPNPGELLSWFTKPNNLAVVCGWQGLTVIDFDMHNPGDPDWYPLWRAVCNLPETYEVATGLGRHVYFFLEEPTKSVDLAWCEIKASGRYVVGEPSIHPTGAMYSGNGLEIARVKSIEDIIPDELMKLKNNTLESPVAPIGRIASAPLDDPWVIAINPPPSVDWIKAIKSHYRILEDYFPNAKPSGRGYYMDRCPLHDDQNPSLSINPIGNTCKCMAGCNGGKTMDVINLHARLHGWSEKTAIDDLWRKIR